MRDWMRTITFAEVEAALDHVKETAGDFVPMETRYVDAANEPCCGVGRVLAHLDVRLPVYREYDPNDKTEDPNMAAIHQLRNMIQLRIDDQALQLLGYVQNANDRDVVDDGTLPGTQTLADVIDEGRANYARVASYSA